jgi:hypothetical protein
MARISEVPDVPAGINRSSVSSALKRLADEGAIDVVEAGRGKRASRYGLKSSANARPSVTTTPVSSAPLKAPVIVEPEPDPDPDMGPFDEEPEEPFDEPDDDEGPF